MGNNHNCIELTIKCHTDCRHEIYPKKKKVKAFNVANTDGIFAVNKRVSGWAITHKPTGYIFIHSITNYYDAKKIAKCVYRCTQEKGLLEFLRSTSPHTILINCKSVYVIAKDMRNKLNAKRQTKTNDKNV